ncbi:MAG TPA: GNAT family N-acetyltransferase [Bacteroidota bacterium]|nr:GNAT family N-acetyltransferase [Bacteroidota bacterium]
MREHTSVEDLVPLASAWTALALESGVPGIFGTFEWTETWWRCAPPASRRVMVLSVWHDGRIACVAPLMACRRWFGPLPVSAVEFVSTWKYAGSAASVLGSMDIIVDPAHRDGAFEALLHYIEGKKWDLLRLHPVREDSLSLDPLGRWGESRGRSAVRTRVFENAVLRAGGGEEGFRTHLSPKFKARLRQAGEKLGRRGAVDFVELTAPADVPGAFGRIVDIEKRSWKWEKGIAITSAAYGDFFPGIALAAAQKGWLRLAFLRLDGREIAYALMVFAGVTATFLKTGYDDAHDDCSPGSLLMNWMFDRRAREGARRIDMFSGDWGYKQRWQAVPEAHCEIQVFSAGLYGRLLRFLYWDLRLYGKGRTPVLLLKRVLRKCGIPWRRSELTRSDQLNERAR